MYKYIFYKRCVENAFISQVGKAAHQTMKNRVDEGKTTLSCFFVCGGFCPCSIPFTVLQMPDCRLQEIYFPSNRVCYSCHSALKQFSSPAEHQASNIFASLFPPVTFLPAVMRQRCTESPTSQWWTFKLCIYETCFQNIRSHPATGKVFHWLSHCQLERRMVEMQMGLSCEDQDAAWGGGRLLDKGASQ